MNDAEVSAAQLRLPARECPVRKRQSYRIVARWWELEAKRGYGSSAASERYARNMRWAAELAGLYGNGTWLELLARAGVKNPEPSR